MALDDFQEPTYFQKLEKQLADSDTKRAFFRLGRYKSDISFLSKAIMLGLIFPTYISLNACSYLDALIHLCNGRSIQEIERSQEIIFSKPVSRIIVKPGREIAYRLHGP